MADETRRAMGSRKAFIVNAGDENVYESVWFEREDS